MEVKVFSTPTCPWCVRVKQFFSEKNVSFEDVDVSSNREAAMEMIEKSGQTGVPVVQVGNTVIVGFNKPAIEQALEEAS